MSVSVYPCMFCIALVMDLFALCVACLTVFVNCLVLSLLLLGLCACVVLVVLW